MLSLKLTRALFVGLLLLVAGHQSALAQKRQSQPATTPVAEDSAATEQKRLVLYRLRSLADYFGTLNDVAIKGASWARLADFMWGADQEYSRALFRKALDVSESPATDKDETVRLLRLKQQIILLIARRDTKLAVQLADKLPKDAPVTNLNSRIAGDLLLQNNSPEEAANFLRRSFSQGRIEHGSLQLLNAFRNKKNETLANSLFLEALASMSKFETVDCGDLLLLGTYIFTHSDPKFSAYPDALVMRAVGKVTVFDLSADRSNIPPQLSQSYLFTVAGILSRPVQASDQRQHDLCYALTYQLLPKANTPELMGAIAAAKANLGMGDMPSLMDRSAKISQEQSKSIEDKIKEVEAIEDVTERDGRYVNLIFGLWREDKFLKARQLADKIDDNDARVRVRLLIDFKEGVADIKSGQLSEAEAIAHKLPPAKAAILWLAIAHASDAGHIPAALSSGIEAARKIENEDGRRPYLMLNAASQMSALNLGQGQELLKEAIKAFNQTSKPVSPIDDEKIDIALSPVKGVARRPYTTRFPIDAPGLEWGFRQTLKTFVETDPEGTISAMKELKDESLRAEGLISIAWALLMSIKT